MSRVAAFACVFVLLALRAEAQARAAATPAPGCRNVVTVYIDFSETITGRAGRDTAAPLHNIATALRHLLTAHSKVLRDGDALSVVAFGQSVVELFRVDSIDDRSRERLDRELVLFTDASWREASLVGDRIPDLRTFSRTTRLDAVLSDVGRRIDASGARDRHLILIASDFAHDDDDSCDADVHMANFAAQLEPFALRYHNAFVGSPLKSPLAQAMLLSVPAARRKRCATSDAVVAADVVARWSVLEPHRVEDLHRLSPEELEREIEERFSSAVRVENARKIDKGRIAFTIVNPNCTEVVVKAVSLQAPNAAPLTIALSREIKLDRLDPDQEVTLAHPAFSRFMNQHVAISPVVGRVRTRPANLFMGDTIHLGRITPRLYPRLGPTAGGMLLIVETDVDIGQVTALRLHVVNLPAGEEGEWTNEISIRPSEDGSKRTYVVPFNAPSEILRQIQKLPGLTIRVDQPDAGTKVVTSNSEKNEHKTDKPVFGPDGRFNAYLPVISGIVAVIVLFIARRYRRVPTAADWAGVVYAVLAVASWIISVIGIETWSIVLRYFSVESVHVWVPALGHASAVAAMTLGIARVYVLKVQWPRMMLNQFTVEEALPRRVRAENAILLLSIASFALTLVLLFYFLPLDGIMVMRKAT